MRRLLSVACCSMLPAAAWAWSPGDPRAVDIAGGVAAVAVAGGEIVVTGPNGTRVLDSSGAVRNESAVPGVAVVARDVDGDGRAEVVVCAADGVRYLPRGASGFGRTQVLSTEACGAVAWDASRIVAVGAKVTAWEIGATGPGAMSTLDESAPAAPIAAAQGAYVAVAGIGGSEVREYGPKGRSVISTGEAIAGLAAGSRGWAWSHPGSATIGDVTRQQSVVAGAPGALTASDVDGDGDVDLVVLHGDRLGVLLAGDPFERVVAAPAGSRSLALGDVDGDRCGDLILGTATGATILRGTCVMATTYSLPSEIAEVKPEPARSSRVAVGHVSPAPPGLDEVVEEEAPVAGEEAASGDKVRVQRRSIVLDGDPRLQVHAGTLLLANLLPPGGQSRSFAGRGGPPGLVVMPDGQLRYDAQVDHVGTWHVSVRMWGGSAFVQTEDLVVVVLPPTSTPGLDVEEVSAEEAAALADAEAGAESESTRSRTLGELAPPRGGPFGLDVCLVSIGVAGGGTWLAADSWDRVGTSPYRPAGSPSAAITCEAGGPKNPIKLFGGLDTAPTFAYMSSGTQLVHLGAGSGGLSIGGEKVRVGPYLTLGLVVAGVGVRGVIVPWGKGNSHQGVEIRATWLASSDTAFQGMVMYTRQLGTFR